MIILYIALALLLLVGTILLLPVKITVEYDTQLRLDASLLGYSLWSLPRRKKKVRYSRYSSKALARKKKRALKKRQRLLKKGGAQPQLKNEKKTGLVGDIEFILRQIGAILSRGYKHVRIEVERLIVRVVAEDASQTAILFGAVNEAAASLLAYLDEVGKWKRTRRTRISIAPDFASEKSFIDVKIILTFRLWQVADVLLGTSLVYEEILFGPAPNYEYNIDSNSQSNK